MFNTECPDNCNTEKVYVGPPGPPGPQGPAGDGGNLQVTTDQGNDSTNVIQITGEGMLDLAKDGTAFTSSGITKILTEQVIGGINIEGSTSQLYHSINNILLELTAQTTTKAGATFRRVQSVDYIRVSGAPGVNPNDFVTKSQLDAGGIGNLYNPSQF